MTDDENITYDVTTDGDYTATIDAQQTDADDWASESTSSYANIGGLKFAPKTGDGAWVVQVDADGKLSVTTGGYTAS